MGVQLKRTSQGRLPDLRGDKRKFKQIVINLLSNAIKFTPEGGKVSLGAEINANGGLKVTISDTGIGIAAEDFDKAMAPFSQVDSTLSRKHDGTGLGLPITEASTAKPSPPTRPAFMQPQTTSSKTLRRISLSRKRP